MKNWTICAYFASAKAFLPKIPLFTKVEWPFLAPFAKIAISQPKRIQIKKIGPVRIRKG
jgi:hypothetical protein